MPAPRARPRPVVGRFAAFVAAGAAAMGTVPVSAWAKAALSCTAERAGDRALVTTRLSEGFDREMLRLVQLGLVGRLHTEARLYRRRGFWFDARVAETKQSFVMVWSKERGGFLLENRRVADPTQIELPVLALRPADPDDRGEYVEITLRLEVITARSLGQVAAWLVAGDGDDQPGRAALPRALVDYLAADLARTTTGRCRLPQ